MFMAKKDKGKALKALKDELKRRQENLVTAEQDFARYRFKLDLEKLNTEAAKRIKKLVFEEIVGTFEPGLLNDLIKALEDAMEELATSSFVADEARGLPHGAWLERANASMDAGDELAAAMYGSLAFEQLLRDLNRSLGIGFDFRVPHHNSRFLDKLNNSGKASPSMVGKLWSLKSRRDMFTHRMHQVAAMSTGKRTKLVRRFLGDLAKVAA